MTNRELLSRRGVIAGLGVAAAGAAAGATLGAQAAEDAENRCTVVAAYPHGSADIESSVSRIPKYTAQMQEMGV